MKNLNYLILSEKGDIKNNYSENTLKNLYPPEEFESFINSVRQISGDMKKENYLEISSFYSCGYQFLLKEFKKGFFLSDSAFESLLVYHHSVMDKTGLEILNYRFTPEVLES